MLSRIRSGSLYFLRPVGTDASDVRVSHWKDYIVRVVCSESGATNRTPGHCHVETRQGEFIGLVLIASLQPLDRRTKNALRREARRTAQSST